MNLRILSKILWILPLAGGVMLGGCAAIQAQRDQLAVQDRTIQRLREDNKQFQDAYYKIKEQFDNQNSQSQKSVDQLTRDLDQARNVRTQKEKELGDQLRARNLEFDAYKKQALDQQVQVETQIGQLQQNVQALTTERDATLAKLKDTDGKLRTEQTRATDLTQQVSQLKVDVKTLNDQIAGLQKDLASRDAALKSEKDARLAAEQKNTDNEKLLADRNKQLADQGKQLQQAKTQLDDAQKKLAAASRNQDAMEALKKEKDSLAAELKTAQARHERELGEAKAGAKHGATATGKSTPADDPDLKKQASALEQKLKGVGSAKGTKVKVDERGLRVIVPGNLLFEENKATLAGRAAAVLGPIAQALKQMDGRPVRVEGHTDNAASPDPYADNWVYGFARADRVREFLMNAGVDPDRLTALSRAQFDPQTSNDTADGKKQNRRVEIVVGEKP